MQGVLRALDGKGSCLGPFFHKCALVPPTTLHSYIPSCLDTRISEAVEVEDVGKNKSSALLQAFKNEEHGK